MREEILAASIRSKFMRSPAGCWLWTAYCDRKGYGIAWHEGKHVKAHRLVYQCLIGPIPDGLQIDHICRVKNCVNPSHLEPVSPRENILRARLVAPQVTQCLRGHAYTAENTYLHNGKKHCKECAVRPEKREYRRLRTIKNRDKYNEYRKAWRLQRKLEAAL